MRITSFDRIEKQFDKIKSVESEGINLIRPTRRRFNLKILAEAAYAVHRSKYTVQNLQYKNDRKDERWKEKVIRLKFL